MESFSIFDPADGSGLFFAWHGGCLVDVYRHEEPELQAGERFAPGWPAEEVQTLQLQVELPDDPGARLEAVRAAVAAWHEHAATNDRLFPRSLTTTTHPTGDLEPDTEQCELSCGRPAVHADGLCDEHHEAWHDSLDGGWSDG